MAAMDKNLNKLERLLNLMDEDALTKQEFVKSFEAILKQILKLEEKLIAKIDSKTVFASKELDNLQKLHKQIIARIEKENETGLSNLKKWAIKKVEELFAKSRIKEKIAEIDEKLATVKDGKDADSEQITKDVLAQIKLPEQKEIILDDAFKIRDKLESLKGEEELQLSAIEELRKELKQEIANIPRGRGGGARKVTYIKRENLSSQCDGSTKTFTMPKDTIDVLGVWGTSFPINFNPGTDWTFAGRTLTLTSEVSAPETGQTLYALIETLFYG